MSTAQCPPALKGVAHYLKIAEDHDNRDVAISYWCRLYALEVAMQISANSKTPEINKFLLMIMDWLEKVKGENLTNDCITNKTCAQSYVENYCLKLFQYGDEQDQAENYGKNVVKAFYTAGILMDVLSSFGDLDEEMSEKQKYSKWKAAYIHNCLKVGERPTPGSFDNKQSEFTAITEDSSEFKPQNDNLNDDINKPSFPNPPSYNDINPPFNTSQDGLNVPMNPANPAMSNYQPQPPHVSPVLPNVPSQPAYVPQVGPNVPAIPTVYQTQISSNSDALNPEQIQKAQKYCKWATSALNYDDVKTAIENLHKALALLQTGKELPE